MFSNHKEKLFGSFFLLRISDFIANFTSQNFDLSHPMPKKHRHISALDYNTCHLLQNIRSQHLDSDSTRPLSRRGQETEVATKGDSEDHEDSEDEHSNSRRNPKISSNQHHQSPSWQAIVDSNKRVPSQVTDSRRRSRKVAKTTEIIPKFGPNFCLKTPTITNTTK
jgi:hypothetical protein